MIPILAVVSGDSIVSALIWVVCIGVVFWLLHWLLTYIAPPEPFLKVGKVLLALGAVIILIKVIMGLAE